MLRSCERRSSARLEITGLRFPALIGIDAGARKRMPRFRHFARHELRRTDLPGRLGAARSGIWSRQGYERLRHLIRTLAAVTAPLVRSLSHATALLIVIIGCAEARDDDEWQFVAQRNCVAIESRLRPGTAIEELRAVGRIAAPLSSVRRVLDDVDNFPRFMPYVAECRR